MKNTTKILALLLVVVMAMAIVACGSKGREAAGKYTLTKMEEDGEDYTAMLGLLGMDAKDLYIELKDDGTFVMSIMDKTQEGTGEPSSNGVMLTAEGESHEVPLNGNVLRIEEGTSVMEFTKE